MTAPITLETARAKLAAGTPLAAGDVAALFGVNPKTVSRWDRAGVLPAIRLPGRCQGGHRRWDPTVVAEMLRGWSR